MTRRVLCTLVLFLAACKKSETPARHYQMRGVVLKIDIAGKTANIDAEKIDGWMEAMSMDYPFADPADLQKLKPGDKISATVDVRDLNYSLSGVKILK